MGLDSRPTVDRDRFIAAAVEAAASLDTSRREAVGHHGWIDPETMCRRWTGGALAPEAILAHCVPGPLTEPALAALAFAALLEPAPPVEVRRIDRAAVIAGDIRTSGDLSIRAPLIVCGDVVCDGVIADCGPESTVVIAGDCRARGLETSGDFLVLGDLVTEVVHGVYNDNSLVVAGVLQARWVDEDDHDVAAAGGVVAEHHFELGRSDEEAASQATTFLVPELIDTGLWEIHWDDVFARLSAGEPVFADQPRPRLEPEPARPTDAELEGIDVEAVLAATRRSLSRADVGYADPDTGELWFVRPGGYGIAIYDGRVFWSAKLDGKPGADSQGREADQRITLWRERGDLFVEIERFGAGVFVHAGWNNGSMFTFPRRSGSEAAAIEDVAALRRRWSRGLVEVSDTIPDRGRLERELALYRDGAARYLSVCLRDGELVTSDGERRAAGELEPWLAERRRAGWVLKILEWPPFGRMG